MTGLTWQQADSVAEKLGMTDGIRKEVGFSINLILITYVHYWT